MKVLRLMALLAFCLALTSTAYGDGQSGETNPDQLADDTQANLDNLNNGMDLSDRPRRQDRNNPCKDKSMWRGQPQLAEYCSAAELADDAAEASGTLSDVHGVIAGLCGIACYKNFSCTRAYTAATAAQADAATAAGTMASACAICATCPSCVTATGNYGRAQTTANTLTTEATATCTTANKLKASCGLATVGGVITDMTMAEDMTQAGMGMMGAMSGLAAMEGTFTAAGWSGVSKTAASEALAGSGGAAGKNAAGQTVNSAGQTGQQVAQGNAAFQSGNQTGMQKVMACTPFILETTNAIMHDKQEDLHEATAEDNRAKARALISQDAPSVSLAGSGAGLPAAGPDRSGGGSNSGKVAAESGDVGLVAGTACGSARKGGGLEAKVQCASTVSPDVASRLLDPRLHSSFKDATGLEVADLIDSSFSPAQSIGAALDAATGGQGGEVVAAVEGYAASVGLESSGPATYLAGGSKASASNGDDEMNAAMAAMVAKLGKKNANRKTAGKKSKSIEFKMARSKAQIEADRSLSLFDRVSYRYQKSRTKLARLRWKSKYNRAIAHMKAPKRLNRKTRN